MCWSESLLRTVHYSLRRQNERDKNTWETEQNVTRIDWMKSNDVEYEHTKKRAHDREDWRHWRPGPAWKGRAHKSDTRIGLSLVVYLCLRLFSDCPFVRPSVRPFVRVSVVRLSIITLANTIVWKLTNRFWCQLAQEVRGPRAWNGQLWGSEGQRSRSREAKDRFGGLVQASFLSLTTFGRVAFHFYCHLLLSETNVRRRQKSVARK